MSSGYMNYIVWAVIALIAYSLVAPLMKIALTEIPTAVAVTVSNTILVIAAVGLVVLSRESVGEYLFHAKSPYMYAAGICLAIGILAYYQALAGGPVSIVVPIFGLFIAASSIIGMIALDEPVTARKMLGIIFALLAVYFTSVE